MRLYQGEGTMRGQEEVWLASVLEYALGGKNYRKFILIGCAPFKLEECVQIGHPTRGSEAIYQSQVSFKSKLEFEE